MAIIDVRDILGSDVAEKKQIIVIGVPRTFRYMAVGKSSSGLLSENTLAVDAEGRPLIEDVSRKNFNAHKKFIRGASGVLLTGVGDYEMGPSDFPKKPFAAALEWYAQQVDRSNTIHMGPTSSSKETGRPNAPRVLKDESELPFKLGEIVYYKNGDPLTVNRKDYYIFFAVIAEDFQDLVLKSTVKVVLEDVKKTIINNSEQTASVGIIVLPLGCEGGGLQYTYDPDSPETSGIHDLIVETLEDLPNNVYIFEESSAPDSTTGIGGTLEDDDNLGISNKALYVIYRERNIAKTNARESAQRAFRDRYLNSFATTVAIEENKERELKELEAKRGVQLNTPEYDAKLAQLAREEALRKTPENQAIQIEKFSKILEEGRVLTGLKKELEDELAEATADAEQAEKDLTIFYLMGAGREKSKEAASRQKFTELTSQELSTLKEATTTENKIQGFTERLSRKKLSERDREATQAELKAAKSKLSALGQKIKGFASKIETAEAEVFGYYGSVKDSIAQQIDVAVEEKAKLEAEKAKLPKYSTEYNEKEDAIQKAENTISQLRSLLETDVGQITAKIKALRRTMANLEKEIAAISRKSAQAKDSLASIRLKLYQAPDFLTNPNIRTPEYSEALKAAKEEAEAKGEQGISEEKYKTDRINEEKYKTERKNIEVKYNNPLTTLADYVALVSQELRALMLAKKPENDKTLTPLEQSELEDEILAAKKEAEAYIKEQYNKAYKELVGDTDTPSEVAGRDVKLFNTLGLPRREFSEVFERMHDDSLSRDEQAKASARWKKLGKRRSAAIALGKQPIENFKKSLQELGRMLSKFGDLDGQVEKYLTLRDCEGGKKSEKIAELTREIEQDLKENAESNLDDAQEELNKERTSENIKKLKDAKAAAEPAAIKARANREIEDLQNLVVVGPSAGSGKNANKKPLFEAYKEGLEKLSTQASYVVTQLDGAAKFVNSELSSFYNVPGLLKEVNEIWEECQAQTQSKDISEMKEYANKLSALAETLSKLKSGFNAAADLTGYDIISDANVPPCEFADTDTLRALAESLFSVKKNNEINIGAQTLIVNRGYSLKGNVKALKDAVLADRALVRQLAVTKLLSQLAEYVDRDGIREIAKDERTRFYKFITNYDNQLKRALSGDTGAIRFLRNANLPAKYDRLVKNSAGYSDMKIAKLAEEYAETEAGQLFLTEVVGEVSSEVNEVDNGLAYAIVKIGVDTEIEKEGPAKETLNQVFNTYYDKPLSKIKRAELDALVGEYKKLQGQNKSTAPQSRTSSNRDLARDLAIQKIEKARLVNILRGLLLEAAKVAESKIRPFMTEGELTKITENLSNLDTKSLKAVSRNLPRTTKQALEEARLESEIAKAEARIEDLDESKSAGSSNSSQQTQLDTVVDKLRAIKLKIRQAKLKTPLSIDAVAQALAPVRECAAAIAYASAKAAWKDSQLYAVTTRNVAAASRVAEDAYKNSGRHLTDLGSGPAAVASVTKALQKAAAIHKAVETFESQIGEKIGARSSARGYAAKEDAAIMGINAAKFIRDEAQYERLQEISALCHQIAKTLGVIAFDADAADGFKTRREQDIKAVEASVKEFRAYLNGLRLTLSQDPNAPFEAFELTRDKKTGKITVDYYDYDPGNAKSREARADKLEELIETASDYLEEREALLARLKRKKIRRRKGGVFAATEDDRLVMTESLLTKVEEQRNSELAPSQNNEKTLYGYLNYLMLDAPLSGDQPILKLVKIVYKGSDRFKVVPSTVNVSDDERAQEIVDLSNRAIEDIAAMTGREVSAVYSTMAEERIKQYIRSYLRGKDAADTEQSLRVISIKGTNKRPELVVSEEIIDSASDRKARIQELIQNLTENLGSLGKKMTERDYIAYLKSEAAYDLETPLICRNPKTGFTSTLELEEPGLKTLPKPLSEKEFAAEAAAEAAAQAAAAFLAENPRASAASAAKAAAKAAEDFKDEFERELGDRTEKKKEEEGKIEKRRIALLVAAKPKRDININVLIEETKAGVPLQTKNQYLTYLRSDLASDTNRPLFIRDPQSGAITRAALKNSEARRARINELISTNVASAALQGFADKMGLAASSVSLAVDSYSEVYLANSLRTQAGRIELREAVEKMKSQIDKIGAGKGSSIVAGPPGFSAAIRGALEESLGYKEFDNAGVPTLAANQAKKELVSQLNGEINAFISQLAQDYLPIIEQALFSLSGRKENPAGEDDPVQSVLKRLLVKTPPLTRDQYLGTERETLSSVEAGFLASQAARTKKKIASILFGSDPKFKAAYKKFIAGSDLSKILTELGGNTDKLNEIKEALDKSTRIQKIDFLFSVIRKDDKGLELSSSKAERLSLSQREQVSEALKKAGFDRDKAIQKLSSRAVGLSAPQLNRIKKILEEVENQEIESLIDLSGYIDSFYVKSYAYREGKNKKKKDAYLVSIDSRKRKVSDSGLPEDLVDEILALLDEENSDINSYLEQSYDQYLSLEQGRFTLSLSALDALKAVVARCSELEALIRGGDSASSYGALLAGQALAVSESDARVRFLTAIGAQPEEVVNKRGKAITKLVPKFKKLSIAVFGASEVGSHVAEITENSDEIENIKSQLEAGETDEELKTALQYLTATNRELETDAAVYAQLSLYVNALFDRVEEVYKKKDILIIVGMTEGFSQLVAETAMAREIPVRAEVPYRKESTGNPYQDRVWGKESQLPKDNRAPYYAILEYAEKTGGVYYTAETRPTDYEIVNGQAMVDLAEVVWIYPGDVKGLSAIEQYARKKGAGVYELPVEVSKLTRSGGDRRKNRIAFRRSEGVYDKWSKFYNAENRAGLTVVTVDYYETLLERLESIFNRLQGKLISRKKALDFIRYDTSLPYVLTEDTPDLSSLPTYSNGEPDYRGLKKLPNGEPDLSSLPILPAGSDDFSAIEKQAGRIPFGTAELNQDIKILADRFFDGGGEAYLLLVAAKDKLLQAVNKYNRNNGTEYTVTTIAALPENQLPPQITSLIDDIKAIERPLLKLAKIMEDAANSASTAARAERAPEALLRRQKAAMAPSAAQAAAAENKAELLGALTKYLKYLEKAAYRLSEPLQVLKFDRDEESENLQVYISPATGKLVVVPQVVESPTARRIKVESLRKDTKEVLYGLSGLRVEKPVYAGTDYTGPVGDMPKYKQQEEMLVRSLSAKLERIAEKGKVRIQEINKLYLDLSALPGEERSGFAQEKIVELAGKEGLQRRRRPVGRPGRRSNPESTPISVFATELGIDFDPSLYSASQDSCRHCATSLLYLQREIDPSLDISDALHDLSSDDANSVLCNRIARETARLVRSAYRSGSQSATRKISSLVARTMEDCEGRG